MSTWTILLIVYILCVVSWVIYVLIQISKKKSRDKFEVIVFLITIPFAPLCWLVGLILAIVRKAQNPGFSKPKPLPKKLRGGLKKDRVLFEGKVMSIAEVNRYTGEHYSLEDVYGKKYVASLSEEDRRQFDDGIGSITVDEKVNTDDPTYKVIQRFAEACSEGVMEPIRDLFTADVTLVLYERETLHGAEDVLYYWQDRYARFKADRIKSDYEIIPCMFYNGLALQITPDRFARMIVLFRFSEGKIAQIAFMPQYLNSEYHYYGGFREAPYYEDYFREYFTSDIEAQPNRVPCPNCGEYSEKLSWHEFYDYQNGFKGIVSVCPHCHRTVEIKPTERYDDPEHRRGRASKVIEAPGVDEQLLAKYGEPLGPSGYISLLVNFARHYINASIDKLCGPPTDNSEVFIPEKLFGECFPHIRTPRYSQVFLSLASSEHDDHGDVSYFFIQDILGHRTEPYAKAADILKSLIVEKSIYGAWEAYLFSKTRNLYPTYWHGGYSRESLIFSREDLAAEPSQYGRALEVIMHGDDLQPRVYFIGDRAFVESCVWTDWGGLFREKVEISFEGDRIKDFVEKKAENLYRYDCGIMF